MTYMTRHIVYNNRISRLSSFYDLFSQIYSVFLQTFDILSCEVVKFYTQEEFLSELYGLLSARFKQGHRDFITKLKLFVENQFL